MALRDAGVPCSDDIPRLCPSQKIERQPQDCRRCCHSFRTASSSRGKRRLALLRERLAHVRVTTRQLPCVPQLSRWQKIKVMDGNILAFVPVGTAIEGDRSRFPASDFRFCGDLCASARHRKFKPGLVSLERRPRFHSFFHGSCDLSCCPENDAPWPGAT